MKPIKLNSKMSRRDKRMICKDLEETYRNTDYSNYEIKVAYDPEKKTLIIPKPVYALSIVDEDLHDWINEQVDTLSIEKVLVA